MTAALPNTVRVGYQRYTVHWSQPAWDALLLRDERARDSVGHTKTSESSMWVQPGQAPDEAANTLLHEVVHAVFAIAGIDFTDGTRDIGGLEEHLVGRITPVLQQVLVDNPKLVAYLQDPA